MKSITIFTAIIVLLTIIGCANFDIDIPGLHKAANAIKEGLKEVAWGMDRLDPVGIKKLLDENAELRAIVDKLTRVAGTYQPITSKVIIKAILKSGSCKSLDIYIDEELRHSLHNLTAWDFENWADSWHYGHNFKRDAKAKIYDVPFHPPIPFVGAFFTQCWKEDENKCIKGQAEMSWELLDVRYKRTIAEKVGDGGWYPPEGILLNIQQSGRSVVRFEANGPQQDLKLDIRIIARADPGVILDEITLTADRTKQIRTWEFQPN